MISGFVAIAFAGTIIAMFVGLVRLQRQMGACDDGSCEKQPE